MSRQVLTRRRVTGRAIAAVASAGLCEPGVCKAGAAGPAWRPAGRGGSLLPAGWLSTDGAAIVDDRGRPVRIASIGWDGSGGPAGYALQGLWAVSYGVVCDSIVAAGFNAVRIPWSDVNLDARPLNQPVAGTIDYRCNPDLAGLSTWKIFRKIVVYAGQIGLKVIFDHHTNDGGGGQQPNGLWFDAGPGSNGQDGAGHHGTIPAAVFKANWLRFAREYANNPTVIGFDLHNEPHHVSWGAGGPSDALAMYTDVGNAICAINPEVLIICEGPQDYRGGAPEGDLRPVLARPVRLRAPRKVVYSIHAYPGEISGAWPDAGAVAVARYESRWGFVARQRIAPLWIGEMGASDPGAGGSAHDWAETLLAYMNGFDPPLSGSWWTIGAPGAGAKPNGLQHAWGVGHYRPEQIAVTDRMLFRP